MQSFRSAAKLLVAATLFALPVLGLAPSQPTVVTTDGPIAGFHRDGVVQFRGIPYAAPPVGPLRWRPPQPHAKWSATLDTVSFGDTCVQNQPGLFAKPSLTENCLYLNVYAPENYAAKPEHRGVLVWFYGGAMTAGESNDYDGTKLAKLGDTVVVTVNFRVGYLGFFAQTALDAEGHAFGNYGTMDQQFALRWIQRNIAKFGGDPKRVTIFGQSGGATAVMSNLVSPQSAGLFQRLINESGTHITATPLAAAEARGASLVTKAGCAQAADVMQCMRALTPLQILSLGLPTPNFLVLDGHIITGDPYQQYKTGQFNHVPIMTGLVEDEQAFFLPEISGGPPVPLTVSDLNDFINSFGADNVAGINKIYPLQSYPSPSEDEIAIAEGSKACIARTFDREWSQYVPVYAYRFDDETTPSYFPPVSYPTRAFHTSELEYLFVLFHGGQGTPHPLNAAQTRLSDQMVAYWTTFARTGNPNNAMDPKWLPYSAASDDVISLREPKPQMMTGYGSQNDLPHHMHNACSFWDQIPLTGALVNGLLRALPAAGIVLAAAFLAMPRMTVADTPAVIRIETSDYDLSAEPYYGVAAGIFARHGITLQFLPAVEGGANMIRDVGASKADIGFSNLISIAGAVQSGAPIVLIAPAGLYERKEPVNAIVVAPNSPIHTAKDLNGKNISSPSGPGSAGALAPAAWLDQNGGDSTSVHFVTGIAPLDLPAALNAGTVAAGEVGDPQLTLLRQRGDVRVLAAPFDAEGDHYLLAGFVASKAWMTANPDVARRFVAAMTDTARWANAHRAETGRLLAARLKLTPEVTGAMSRTEYAETLTAGTIQPPLDVAAKYGIIKPMKADELLHQ